MAVQIFKDDREEWIQPEYLNAHLEAGWTLEKGEKPTFDEVDTNDSGKLSSEEVRQAAKEANIDGWDTKRIKTLKQELEL